MEDLNDFAHVHPPELIALLDEQVVGQDNLLDHLAPLCSAVSTVGGRHVFTRLRKDGEKIRRENGKTYVVVNRLFCKCE